MKWEDIQKAESEAQRFLKAVALLHKLSKTDWEITGNKWSGAVRRASLDLTRALAEMRKATR
jgi:hypothetical protein